MDPLRIACWAVLVAWLLASPGRADEPVTPANFKAPADNRKDEPLARQFSLGKAVDFLDSASLAWQSKQNCFSCHTNFAYLYARPLVSAKSPAASLTHDKIRAELESMVSKRWPDKKPRWDAEVVASAAALAFNDAHTTKQLHPLTKTALDRMWTVQRPDGGWSWLKCNWPPMEIDDHYGATLALLAVGVAPGDYAKTEAAQKGLAGIRAYLQKNPPQNLHHKTMTLWAATHLDGFLSADEKQAIVKELAATQRPDGGWSAAALGDKNWARADKLEQDPLTSDGYGTGFVVYVLRRAGVPAADPGVQKGVAWLKANQRESGRWFARSLNRDNKHYLSHVGTAFAVMALSVCEEAKR